MVKLEDFPGNGKAKAEVLFIISGRIGPVKSLKYRIFGTVRNSRPIIRYRKKKSRFFLGKGEEDRSVFRCIAYGIVYKDREYL